MKSTEVLEWLNDLLKKEPLSVNRFFLDNVTPCGKNIADDHRTIVRDVAGATFLTPMGLINSIIGHPRIRFVTNQNSLGDEYIEKFELCS